jgi:peptidoglycan hydrolase CwlO-like protein
MSLFQKVFGSKRPRNNTQKVNLSPLFNNQTRRHELRMKINDLERYNQQRDELLEKVKLLDEKIEKIEGEIANLRKKVPNHVGGTRRRRRA